jgi:hypothetical protein
LQNSASWPSVAASCATSHHTSLQPSLGSFFASCIARYCTCLPTLAVAKVWADYIRSTSESSPFFRENGARIFRRSKFNDRKQRQVVNEYCENIRTTGLMMCTASPVVVMPSVDDPHTWTLEVLGGATRVEAVYQAVELDPSNVQVQATVCTCRVYGVEPFCAVSCQCLASHFE